MDVFNVFGNIFFWLIESVEIVVGVCYSKECYFNIIQFLFVYGVIVVVVFDDGVVVFGIEFQDDNILLEVSVFWDVIDQINFYVVYKIGFKFGGVDNLVLFSVLLVVVVLLNNFDLLVF